MGNKKKNLIIIILIIIIIISCVFAISIVYIDKNYNNTNFALSNVETENISDVNDDILIDKSSYDRVATRSKIDKMIFLGDIMCSDRLKERYDAGGIRNIVDDEVYNILENKDIVMANLECPISNSTKSVIEKKFVFCMPPKYAKILNDMNVDLVTIANNHTMDYGEKGILETIETLDSHNIDYIGGGENIKRASESYIKIIDGKSYAFITGTTVVTSEDFAATDVKPGIFSTYNTVPLYNEIRNLRDKVDKIIVFMHWGNELEPFANKTQKTIAHSLVNVGADVVIGSHPHVPQDIEYYEGKPIVYSLGNMLYGRTNRDSMIAEVSFDYSKDENGEIILKVIPVRANYEKTSRYWNEEEEKSKFDFLRGISKTVVIDDNGIVTENQKEIK